jgi:hypothetical protein
VRPKKRWSESFCAGSSVGARCHDAGRSRSTEIEALTGSAYALGAAVRGLEDDELVDEAAV